MPTLTPHQPALDALCRRFNVRRLFLFGSATSPLFDPARSDYDFYVDFAPPTTGGRADQYFGFLSALESLLGRKVDLVEVGAIANPIILEAVERTKVPIYVAA